MSASGERGSRSRRWSRALSLSTPRLPPCASTRCRTMARPSPALPPEVSSPSRARDGPPCRSARRCVPMRLGDANPVIGHREAGAGRAGFPADADLAARMAVLDRVVRQVEQRLPQPGRVGRDARSVRRRSLPPRPSPRAARRRGGSARPRRAPAPAARPARWPASSRPTRSSTGPAARPPAGPGGRPRARSAG